MSAYYSMTPQLNFSVTDNMVPRYRYAKIPLNNLSSGTVPFNSTSQTLVEIKIPASTCFNLSKSFLCYQYTIPAGPVGSFAAVHENGFDFQQVFFGSGSGLGIVDMTYSNRYKKAVQNLRNTFEQDFQGGFQDQMTQYYPSRQAGATNVYPQSIDGVTAGVLNASPINNTDSQQLLFSSLVSAAADVTNNATALQVTRQVPLSVLKDTFFDMDKDVVFGSDMYLRLFTAAIQQMCFYTPNRANPHIGATAFAQTAFSATNMYLQLALEENIDIRNSLLMSLAKGSIKMDIPYTYCYRFSNNTANANLSLTLTKNYGKSLNRILFVPFNGNEFSHLSYDLCNLNGGKVSQVQTTLNGRPLQDSIIQCYNPQIAPVIVGGVNYTTNAFAQASAFGGVVDFGGDWRQIREFAKGSCLQSYPHYQANWVWQDGWGIPSFLDEKNSGRPWYQNSEGLSLIDSGDLVYSIQASTPNITLAGSNCNSNGLILYLFCTFNRTLTIQADGLILSA
jgi:hypothetical protein